MASPGRNELCPCGSGRKFKHCCLQVRDADDMARMRLRGAEGALVPALFVYAAREFGNDFFSEAWEEFFLWHSVTDDVADSREFGTTFDPYFVFSFVADPAEEDLPADWPTEPVALHFMREQVEACPDFHREFVQQACKSPPSFFVVESAEPGRAIDLRDILTGRCLHVLEQSASRTLRRGDITFTRVITAGGASIMIGASPWVIPPAWHLHVIDFREKLRPRRLLTRDDLLEYEIEIRSAYHEIVRAILHPALPALQNTDGDRIEPTTMTYTLAVSASEAFERLRPLATLDGEVYVDGEVSDEAGALTAATLTWIKRGNRQHKDWNNTTLGALRLEGQRLVVDVNSARRRDRIAKEIAKRFGSLARLVDTKVTDVAQSLEACRVAGGGTAPTRPSLSSVVEQAPELAALEAEFTRRHWHAWIDAKVPALGNRTPRQAAKTARGRERLAALLADVERMAERSSSAGRPDVGELRRRLGLNQL
jgi:SEC-C motif